MLTISPNLIIPTTILKLANVKNTFKNQKRVYSFTAWANFSKSTATFEKNNSFAPRITGKKLVTFFF